MFKVLYSLDSMKDYFFACSAFVFVVSFIYSKNLKIKPSYRFPFPYQ